VSTKNVSIRATLDSSQFVGGLRQMKSGTEAFSKAAKSSLKESFHEGLKEAGKELKATGQEVKSLFKSAVTLGGAFSFEEGVRGAIKMRGKLSDLAFMVSEGEKRQVSWNDIHEEIAPIADKTTRSVDELADAYAKMYSATGNREVAAGSLEAIGTIATASGKSVESLAGIAGALNEKFKISAKQMPAALATVIELASKGGVEFEELQNVIETTGASALSAGLEGEAGLKKMLAMANIGGDALKNMGKGVRQVSQLFDSMVNPEFQKKLNQLHLGVKTTNQDKTARDSTKVLEDILVKAKGKREQLAKIFSGEQLKLVVALGADFTKTYESTQGDLQTKVDAARKAFEASLAKASESSTSYAEIQKKAQERIDTDPAAGLRKAMNKIEEAFMKPQMLAAIDKLAAKLPELAEKLASFVEFATEHPAATAAGAVAANVGMGALPGMIGSGVAGLGGAALKGLKAARAAKAVSTVATAAESAGAGMPEWMMGNSAAAAGAGEGAIALEGGAAAAAGGAGAAGGATGIGAVAAALGPVGAGLAAVAAVTAAGYNAYKLVKENQASGGVLANLKEAFGGKTSNPVSGDEYLKRFKGAKPDVVSGASEPAVAKAVEGVKKHGSESDKAAASMSRLAASTDRLTAYFSTLEKSAPGGGGVAKGPKTLGGVTTGATPRGPSS
jgi:TP901 family phage tail tape measure protein